MGQQQSVCVMSLINEMELTMWRPLLLSKTCLQHHSSYVFDVY